MELVVFANSPIGNPGQFFRDVVTNIYLDNIIPEIPVGGWIARHGLTAEKYQEAFNDYVGNHGMQLMDVSGYAMCMSTNAFIMKEIEPYPERAQEHFWRARAGAVDGDLAEGFFPLGQCAALVDSVLPAAEIVEALCP